MKTDPAYLKKLIDECNDLRKETGYRETDDQGMNITYLAVKDRSFIGYHQGYYEQHLRKEYGLEEKDSIRSNCKNYLKIMRNDEDGIIQITSYKNGVIDCIHQGSRKGNKTFLFPFSASGGYYPTYSYVTVHDGDDIAEEYAVNGKQIVYDAYGNNEGGTVSHYRINHVSEGKVPVLEESGGIIRKDTLEYKLTSYEDWLKDRR